MLVPKVVHVRSIEHHTKEIFTLRLAHPDGSEHLPFAPGQFNMLYLFGCGEAAISISGDASKGEGLVHTIHAVGTVTNGLQQLKEGDQIGLRGPFGSTWPLDWKGHDIVVIAGGLGLPPLRPVLLHSAQNKGEYGQISLLYGARTPNDFLFQDDLKRWETEGFNVALTVDSQTPEWTGNIGVVTRLIPNHLNAERETAIYICGPEVMIRAALKALPEWVDPEKVFVSMERNMQCGVGFCGHCQFGPYFLCKDGPVFSYAQLNHWLPVHEL